ncbi:MULTISPECIES: sugar porter family MFS transporter [unclassified Mucilaginibacter]|uniref:sugar porter family MFS transporter n=1 Tax=unclassified Mucilaginibacter TaxID=2617802 RepID=UPI002AC9C9E4|nr:MULTISPECIES: sugar porter family MFS transporter [unclassified Mucilaginibacter]MEB0261571.1 sugar porter family MFS transporter [Mucilaginibacter sp. 10I4]MEB0277177.1 sugar porter family MFS transporter [Mucilaginibacter sp. 10B2]MEB0300825.1 sugar porter family MFS transporter [Mucilaginibacter sp. 5C4]WPX25274.1 sugar porter family MFS transporter [Mucilaginibacter sp. 5C4]
MKIKNFYTISIAFTAAIGGFLLGFDGSVISGAAPFYKSFFNLNNDSLIFGFSVSCIIWGAIFGNLFAGKLSDKFGRKPALLLSAILFLCSSLITALAGNITIFIAGRIMAGVGVGIAILLAPVYIAEIAPPKKRGWLVSFNQLLIVIGLSAAYFSNYFILNAIHDPLINWRWMLGIEAFPSLLYFIFLFFIPESPRWLIMKNKDEKAISILEDICGKEHAIIEYDHIKKSLQHTINANTLSHAKEFFSGKMKLTLIIGFGLAILQQFSGINAVLYYAPMIFESAGGARDTAFMQAIVLGLVFMITTIASMFFIDKLGRKPLLFAGVGIMSVSLLVTGFAFKNASYTINIASINSVANQIFKDEVFLQAKKTTPGLITYSKINLNGDYAEVFYENNPSIQIPYANSNLSKGVENRNQFIKAIISLKGQKFNDELTFLASVKKVLKTKQNIDQYLSLVLKESINVNSLLVLLSILGFITGFSISLGPVMWAMFSEIFPNHLRGFAISAVGVANSISSFLVATFFPIQLATFGSSTTYFIYAGFMIFCFWFVWKYVVETKGKSLEEIEKELIKA